MKASYHELLKPDLIKTVSGLELIARVIVENYLSGTNHSIRVGHGMEFSQFRNYEPGDDLRLLDWKMLARSGRYYIKQAEIKTNITVKFVLDASNSMLHTDDKLSKMDYARILVASLGYLSRIQGDALGLFAINDQQLYNLYPKIHKQHYSRFLQELVSVQNEGKWPKSTNGFQHLHDRSHKELIFFITDLYEHDDELHSFVKRLKTTRNEVVVLHIMSKKELEFDYSGTLTFQDLETGKKVKVDAKTSKKEYVEALDKMLKATKDVLLANRIGYHLFTLDSHLGETLKLFLKQRSRLM